MLGMDDDVGLNDRTELGRIDGVKLGRRDVGLVEEGETLGGEEDGAEEGFAVGRDEGEAELGRSNDGISETDGRAEGILLGTAHSLGIDEGRLLGTDVGAALS